MKRRDKLRDITQSIALNERVDMINTIADFSSEEYANLGDLWELAKESKRQLRQRLFNIFDYYLNN